MRTLFCEPLTVTGTKRSTFLVPENRNEVLIMTSNKETKRGFINQLARYKAETKSSLQDLADELGYSVPTIQTWLSKTYLPTENNLDNIKIFLAGKKVATPTARLSDETATRLVNELKHIKERDNLLIIDLAEMVGVSESALASWFQGVSKPGALNAYHIQNFLSGRDKQVSLFEAQFQASISQSDMTLTAGDGTQYISSRSVAKWTEKQHKHIIRDIEMYISYLSDEEHSPNLGFGSTMRIESYFVEDTYQSEKGGRTYKFYWCSRKGCELIANKMTGKKGLRFSAQYIEAFHSMEQALKEVPTPSTESISEPKKQIEESPELTYIQTKLKDISQLTDFTAIDEALRQVSSFIKMVIPNK